MLNPKLLTEARKTLVALAGAVAAFLIAVLSNKASGFDPTNADWIILVTGLATSIGVNVVPNKPPG